MFHNYNYWNSTVYCVFIDYIGQHTQGIVLQFLMPIMSINKKFGLIEQNVFLNRKFKTRK